ncbi:MAG: hypothetical protein QGG40_16375, partial [Myxococcota bacterium]|nr:hypothetical protein [Myxococcota bacterium]
MTVWVLVFVLLQGALAADLVESWSLDDDAGFVSTGDTVQWAWGTVSSGPGSGYDGETAWATVLDGDYLHDSTDELTLASVDLTSLSRPVLGFVHWYDIDQDDGAWVEIFSDGAWQVAEPIYGYVSESGFVDASGDWETSWVDLTGLDDSGQVRFVLSTDTSVSRAGWYLDNLVLWDGDPVPPSIRGVSELSDTQDLEGPYVVSATVVDDLATPTVELVWSVGGVEERETLVNQGDDLYEGEIPGQDPDTEMSWWIEASDGENLAISPDEGVHEFRVYLASPTDLTFLDDRLVGTEIELDWTPPDSPHEVLYYRIYRDDEFLEVGMEPPLHVGVEEESHTFEVAAFYDAGEGDRSESLAVDVYLPEVTSLAPAEAWQGDQVRVEVRGSYLLFAEEGVEIEMGAGI